MYLFLDLFLLLSIDARKVEEKLVRMYENRIVNHIVKGVKDVVSH